MSNTLIGSIKITPSNPRPAESFRVEVLDRNGVSYNSQSSASVFIDGIPGPVQLLQAPKVGKRPILIRVKEGDESELLRTHVDISGDPVTFHNSKGAHEVALLSVRQELSSPYVVNFALGHPGSHQEFHPTTGFRTASVSNAVEELLHSRKPTGLRNLVRAMLGSDEVRSITTRKSTVTQKKFARQADVVTAVLDVGSANIADLLQAATGTQPSFEWDFGDGTKKTTASPYVSHDYSQALTADDAILNFEVRCRAVLDNVEVKRSLVLHSAYALCKQRGTIVPPVKADIYAHKDFASFYGEMLVTNIEEEAITLTAQAIVPLTDNPNADERPVFRPLQTAIHLPAGSTTVLGVYPRYRSPTNQSLLNLGMAFANESPSTPSTTAVRPSPQSRTAIKATASATMAGGISATTSAGLAAGLAQALQSEGDVPRDAPGFTVYFAGETASGTPVRFTHVFEIHMDERNKEPKFPGFEPPLLTRRPWPWEEVMEIIEEIITQKGKPAQQLAVAMEKELGIIAVSASRKMLRGKNTPVLNTARDLAKAGLVPMQRLMPQFAAASPRSLHTQATPYSHSTAQAGTLMRSTERASKINMERVDVKTATPVKVDIGQPAVTVFLGPSHSPVLYARSGPPQPGPVAEGEICDPDNIPDADKMLADAMQLVCQMSDEKSEVTMPGRFMNGRRGDVVLSPGGPGLIGSLLRAVDPPQRYSHSGIMTRNYDEVTHSTASEDRIYDYLVGTLAEGTDGIRPDILQWMWPGVVTQKVEAAVNSRRDDGATLYWSDPESGKKYTVSSFSGHAVGVTHNNQFQIVPPLIVKPDPMLETNQVRSSLHTAATTARNDGAEVDENGNLIRPHKSHYRLYCYTDPSIGLTDVAPPTSLWAAGTYPSVCSSYVWMSMKKNNVRLEGDSDIVSPTDLEAEDIAQGAGVLPNTRDGLYWYTAAERLAAGTWLYNEMYYKAYDEAGWFGNLLSDAADDVGNQLVNTFALDNAWGKDNDDWKNTQDANAVSPDNILFWDGPEQGGLYGYAEPLIYREPRKEEYTVSRWKKVLSRGTITGTVRLDGQPIQGAMVALYDGMSDITDSSGTFTLTDVPFGNYQLTASKVIDGLYYSKKVSVSIQQATLTVNVDLEPPAERYRLAQLYIDFYGREDEDFTSDETTNPGPEYYELELGPDRLTNHKHREYSWGGEARVEYSIDVYLLADNSIQVNVSALLYEGTSESTNDLDGTASISFNVPKGQTVGGYIKVSNTQEDEPDTYGELTLSVKNAQNNN